MHEGVGQQRGSTHLAMVMLGSKCSPGWSLTHSPGTPSGNFLAQAVHPFVFFSPTILSISLMFVPVSKVTPFPAMILVFYFLRFG